MKFFKHDKSRQANEILKDSEQGTDYFISLMQLAIDKNNGFGDIIRGLIMKDRNERMVLLSVIIKEFEKNRVDPQLIQALGYLSSDEMVEVARKLIK